MICIPADVEDLRSVYLVICLCNKLKSLPYIRVWVEGGEREI